MTSRLILGTQTVSTYQYATLHGFGASTFTNGVGPLPYIAHTSINVIDPTTTLEQVLSSYDEVYWAECSPSEFNNDREYYDSLYRLQRHNLQYKNIKNLHTIKFDPYGWKDKPWPKLDINDVVFLGGSVAAGVALSDPNTWFSTIVARNIHRNPVNLSQRFVGGGAGNNTRAFEVFTQLDFVPGQVVVLHIAPLERIRYCDEKTGDLVNIQLARLPNGMEYASLLDTYHRKFLFYQLYLMVQAMIRMARSKQLKFVMFLDDYHASDQSYYEQLYFYEFPEFIPRSVIDGYLVDYAEDNSHPGIKSNEILASRITDYIKQVYPQ